MRMVTPIVLLVGALSVVAGVFVVFGLGWALVVFGALVIAERLVPTR